MTSKLPPKLIFALVSTLVILIAAIFLQIKNHFFSKNVILDEPITATSTVSITSTTPDRLNYTQKELLKTYLKDNISQLSPIPEALGGKFYLTELIFTGANTADLSYEDGHNNFSAQIQFNLEADTPYINNFTIISQNNQPYPTPSLQTTSSTSK